MDWKKLLQELAEAGRTQVQIAQHCGVAQSTISDLARGNVKSPSFELGTKLVALHAETTAPAVEPAKAPA